MIINFIYFINNFFSKNIITLFYFFSFLYYNISKIMWGGGYEKNSIFYKCFGIDYLCNSK